MLCYFIVSKYLQEYRSFVFCKYIVIQLKFETRIGDIIEENIQYNIGIY